MAKFKSIVTYQRAPELPADVDLADCLVLVEHQGKVYKVSAEGLVPTPPDPDPNP